MLVFESVSKDLTKLCLSIAQVFSNIASVIQQFTPMNQTNKIVWLVDTIHKAGKISGISVKKRPEIGVKSV